MGISIGVIEFLIELRTAGYLNPGGAVMEIGAQQLGSTCLLHRERLQHLGELFGVHEPLPLPPAPPAPQPLDGSPQVLDSTAPFARDLWRWLGLKYAAIDIDGSPESIPLDLNFDSVPKEETGKYHLVTNFGTTEHVTNQLNAFKIIHDLTALNGIMIHELPAQGMFNHGLVNYNPKFFWLLARSNGYKFVHADFMPSQSYLELPQNVIKFLRSNNLTPLHPFADYKVADAAIFVVMQKPVDIDFVPPLDMNTVEPTDVESLKQRYWTVFEKDALDRPQPSAERAAQTLASSPAASTLDTRQSVVRWRGDGMMNPWATLRRVVRNSDTMAQSSAATMQGIANQSDLINRKLRAIEFEISSQSEVLNRKFDSVIKIMNELREIHKAQLEMQRGAAEAIRHSASLNPEDA